LSPENESAVQYEQMQVLYADLALQDFSFYMLPSSATQTNVQIVRTRVAFTQEIHEVLRRAFFVMDDESCETCLEEEEVAEQLRRFPEGQFVAVLPEGDQLRVVGMATTMRTSYSPDLPARPWYDVIGSVRLENHEPDGDWLYGVEMAVHPAYQKLGIGTKLYEARFNLVRQLGLKGWYAGGQLMGYSRYRDQMSAREYGEMVIRGGLHDPTVSMQIRRGFEPRYVIEDYMEEEPAGNAAVHLVWRNPDVKG
jgi:GNAT superfamily N-acetyltransferase